jgi:lipoprotein-anchoring transpeptidase ErfK/SrfK
MSGREPMVDYAPFLIRAVAALRPNTSEQRQALYDRARRTLVDRLRASNTTLSDTDLGAESLALEAAIRRVEADAVRRSAPKQAGSAYETYAAPVEESQHRPPLKDQKKSLRIVAGAFGVLVFVLAGVAAYSFWPRILSSTRSVLTTRNVGKTAEQPAAASASYVYLRQPVYYRTNHPVGTIVVDKVQGFLYVVRPSLSALRYGIGVGPECTTSAGLYQVVRKEEWPGWKPPSQQSSDPDNDRMKNPLGARALYLNKDYRIHGSNVPLTSEQRVPQSCIRLVNDDIIYLYDRTPLESRVVVLN